MPWLPMHSGHPLMVHLPLVALPLAVLLDALALRRPGEPWRQMATVLWLLGLAGAAGAVTTGLIAYNRVDHSEAGHGVMTLHRNVALGALALLLVSGVVRWRRARWLPAILVGAAGIVGIAGAGYLGGEVVFRHAIGIPTEVLEQVVRERGGHGHTAEPAGVTGVAPADSESSDTAGRPAPAHEHQPQDTSGHSH